ncbi:histidine kinase [Parasphingopyxis algicola]|uniref:sensor histidine kinase n=1 Tax=Parasphingopyxis algicola TaxID=2026624 RepID=UPI0015A2A5ED|nr:histidine kinase [Parasphingopyxis algicola]QLC26111.1 histidine kinase [Parasphingopyxis algicola]
MALEDLTKKPFFVDKNRAFWVLQSVGWSGYFILRSLGGIANNMGPLFILPTAIATATGYCLTLIMAVIFRQLIDRTPRVTWGGSVTVVLIGSAIFSFIEVWAFTAFYRGGEMPSGLQFFGAILLDFTLLVAWSGLYYGINFYILIEEQNDQLLRLENQSSNAHLAMLRYQLNPHFLFNTLNSISTLVLLKQTERANAMLSRLSSFLRYTLANEPTARVPLAQEVETLKLYLEIERMRFEDRLRPSFDIDPRVTRARLPSLLLQPLVENAIKYAVTPQEEGAEIRISAQQVGNRVQITVSDTGPGLQEGAVTRHSSTGVGLANIRDRLVQAFGEEQRFEIKANEGGGFCVEIEIPLQFEQAKEAA